MSSSLYDQTATLRHLLTILGRVPTIAAQCIYEYRQSILRGASVFLSIVSFPVGFYYFVFGVMVGVFGGSPAGGVHGLWDRIAGVALLLIGLLHLIPAFRFGSKTGLLYYRWTAIVLAAIYMISIVPDSWFRDFGDILRCILLSPVMFLCLCFIPVANSLMVEKIKFKEPNQAPTSTAVTPPAAAGDRASGTRGSP